MGKSTDYVILRPGLVMQFGEWAFSTTGTTVNVPTKLGTVTTALCTPESYTTTAGAGEQVMFCAKAISSGNVSVARKVGTESGGKFSYEFIGTLGATPGIISAT